MKTQFKACIIVLFAAIFLSCQTGEREIIVVSNDFTGYVLIIYNQENGEKKCYQDKARVYNIPADGILRTQFSNNPGWTELPLFYYNSIDPANSISYRLDISNVPKDTVVAFGGVVGGANKDLAGNEVVRFKEYFIGNEEQVRESIKAADELDIIQLAE